MRLTTALVAAALSALVSGSALAQLQQPNPGAGAPATKPATPPAVVPVAPAKPATTPAPAAKPVAAPALVNINAATADQLDSIPNIGEKRSEAIIKGRPYKTTQELVSKKALSQGIYDKIKDKITVKVNINTASADELDSLPFIGEKRSAAIIAARPYKAANELVSKKALSQGVFDKVKGFVDVK
jgi:competence protein ComEA